MNNSKLLLLLQNLSAWQLRSFHLLVQSPYFNKNEKVIRCLDALISFYPDFSQISNKDLYQTVFKKRNFNHQQLRYVMTDLTILLETFFIQEALYNDVFLQKQLLLKKLESIEPEKFYNQHIEQAEILIRENKEGLEKQRSLFLLDEINFNFSRKRNSRNADHSLQRLSDSMDEHYVLMRLKFSCEMINRANVLSEKYAIPSIDYIDQMLNKCQFENPLISIYKSILNLLLNPLAEAAYATLKKEVEFQYKKIQQDELRDVYVFLQNYCIRMINNGTERYLEELFLIYDAMIDKEVIFENNELEHLQFKNIITLALRLNKIDWTENFIIQYQNKLKSDLRKNAVSYNTARIHYAKKNYREALRVMRAVEFTDIYYHLDAKLLQLKIYFETENLEPLFSLITTVTTYLKRSSLISSYQRTVYSSLISYIKKLAKYKSGYKVDIAKVAKEINSGKDIADIGWLRMQVATLS